MKSRNRFCVPALALTALTAIPAHASMLGDSVEIWGRAQLNGSESLRDTVVVADPGVEYSLSISQDVNFTLDFTSHSIRLDTYVAWFSPWFDSGHEPTAMEIRDIDVVGDPEQYIGAVSVSFGGSIVTEDGAPPAYAAFSADNIEFGDDWVRIITGPYLFDAGSFVQIDLTFVPAPGAASLFGFAAMGALRRRR